MAGPRAAVAPQTPSPAGVVPRPEHAGAGKRRAIEESFPIIEINRLAIPERNAFKPIYSMHKWFARRASCVFRAILLAAMKPAGTDIMEEFYKDHTDDPDTKGVTVLDPFMGGGTTVIEALRLGCRVVGVDLNPVAWFIVKTEAEAVDIEELKRAFERLAERKTASGLGVRDELLSHYKTKCPCCGDDAADIIYTFWVKSAVCTVRTCGKETPLFANYIVAQKSPSISYYEEVSCPECKKRFDWDLEMPTLVAEPELLLPAEKDKANSGDKRGNIRWAYSPVGPVTCPHCDKKVTPPPRGKKRKKVPVSVVLCPDCFGVFQWRGDVPESVTCPACKNATRPKGKRCFNPLEGNLPDKGQFVCSACGNKDHVIASIRTLREDQLLPTRPYAVEGYCVLCVATHDETEEQDGLFGAGDGKGMSRRKNVPHECRIHGNNGKFFKRVDPADLTRYQQASARWEKEKSKLPYPKSEVPLGDKTKTHLIGHHYRHWHQMFNPRQLLCLATLLKAIDAEENQTIKELLLSAFFDTLNNTSDFASYRSTVGALRQVFARHDYHPKMMPCENNVWGGAVGMGSFSTWIDAIIKGKEYMTEPYDRRDEGDNLVNVPSNERIIITRDSEMLCQNSLTVNVSCDLVITDPPYAGNVNYSELADFFYVWLRLVLSKTYPHFAPEYTPKAEEVIQNATRGKTLQDFAEGLKAVWKRCYENMADDGVLAFTFHHSDETGEVWEQLLRTIVEAGFYLVAVYPIHGESESSLHLQDKKAVSYDLIHVCRKRPPDEVTEQRSWAGVRQEIRRHAREEIQKIEAGRYGERGKLGPGDLTIIMIGKCLEIFSRHYGSVIDYAGNPITIPDALKAIRMMVDQNLSSARPLPAELEGVDPATYVYLTCLCDRKEIKVDEVSKAAKGIIPAENLLKAGVIRKGRGQRGRSYEVKLPGERFEDMKEFFEKQADTRGQLGLFPDEELSRFDRVPLVNVIHFLMGLAEKKLNIKPWLDDFAKIRPQTRAGLRYLRDKNPTFQVPVNAILRLIEI